jgi:hypothetical protein
MAFSVKGRSNHKLEEISSQILFYLFPQTRIMKLLVEICGFQQANTESLCQAWT